MLGNLIITGAGHGIGAATARLAATRGYGVCVNYWRNPELAEAIVNDIIDDGGKAVAVGADVSKAAEVEALFDTAEAALGPITGLINNASRYGTRVELADISTEDIETTLAVTLTGTILCAREAVARMSRSRGGNGGSIVNLSSNAVRTGGYQLSTYVAAKGGIEAFTIALAQEAGDQGIRVNAVSPGAIETETTAAAGAKWRARQEKAIALGRLGTAEEVSAAILWLLSDDAAYITGTILPVTGGRR